MISELENYYKKHGILSTHFTCVHKAECSRNCESFTGPKSALVSVGYEMGALPRLLFLSLDSGSGDKANENRLPLAVRAIEAQCDVMSLPKHKHWFRTHELAWYVLRRFNPALQLEEAKNHFAHANSAKCCMNKAQRKKADKILFKNCRQYLKEELKILDPEILVTQGSEARRAMQELSTESQKTVDEFASVRLLNGKEVFWLHTYHPSCWGAFNRQRAFNKITEVAEGWESYAEEVFQYVRARMPGNSFKRTGL